MVLVKQIHFNLQKVRVSANLKVKIYLKIKLLNLKTIETLNIELASDLKSRIIDKKTLVSIRS
jgi:hypothetical protein